MDNLPPLENDVLCIGVIICIAKKSIASSTIYARKVDENDQAVGNIFELRNITQNRDFWRNEDVSREKISFGSFVKYKKDGDYFIYCGKLKRKPKNIEAIQMEFDYDRESAFLGISDILSFAICHGKDCIAAISMKNAKIENEKIQFTTHQDELVNIRLLCRENLQLSTSSVRLQLRDTTDEDDVGDVAIVQFEPHYSLSVNNPTQCTCVYYRVACVGLLLKYKPTVISIDEEPVKIRAGNGSFIPVPGNVLFDTGNLNATGISEELTNKLGLQEDGTKLKKVKLPDDKEGQFGTVPLQIVVRGIIYKVNALVGVPAVGTDLLIGIDIIKKLIKRKFSFGE